MQELHSHDREKFGVQALWLPDDSEYAGSHGGNVDHQSPEVLQADGRGILEEESTRSFFSYIPEILEDLKDKWNEESLKFQKEYQDPKFDSSGNYISDKVEREKRRNHNKRLMNRVKAAKARYERFQKKIPKLKELQEQYSH